MALQPPGLEFTVKALVLSVMLYAALGSLTLPLLAFAAPSLGTFPLARDRALLPRRAAIALDAIPLIVVRIQRSVVADTEFFPAARALLLWPVTALLGHARIANRCRPPVLLHHLCGRLQDYQQRIRVDREHVGSPLAGPHSAQPGFAALDLTDDLGAGGDLDPAACIAHHHVAAGPP